MAYRLGNRLPGGLQDAERQEATRRALGRNSVMETWVFSPDPLAGVSTGTRKKHHRAVLKSKGSRISQLGIWPDVKKEGHCKKSLLGGSGLSFLLEGGCFI